MKTWENIVSACAVAVILPEPDMLQQAAFAKAGSIALAGTLYFAGSRDYV
jgi:hypothetical protein